MAWTTADIPDQSRRFAVMTGANGGLRLEVASALARQGGQVVMAARPGQGRAPRSQTILQSLAEPAEGAQQGIFTSVNPRSQRSD